MAKPNDAKDAKPKTEGEAAGKGGVAIDDNMKVQCTEYEKPQEVTHLYLGHWKDEDEIFSEELKEKNEEKKIIKKLTNSPTDLTENHKDEKEKEIWLIWRSNKKLYNLIRG